MTTTPVMPYSTDLAGARPLDAIPRSIEEIVRLTRGLSAVKFERSHAPGKWTTRQLVIHLAQSELAFGTRVRMALTTPDYVAQSWDQDVWMGLDARLDGGAAVEAFAALARMNLALFEGLSPTDLTTPLRHPEYGAVTVDWILHQLAGHQIHHLKQLRQVASV